jgi:hypothetical protein
MATLTLRFGATGATGVKNEPLTNTEIDDNFKNLNADIQTRVLTSDYSDTDVLDKIKNVDGSGSGLDADVVRGLNPASVYGATGATGASVVTRDSTGSFTANAITAAQFNGALYLRPGDTLVFEGSGDDAFETTLAVTNPTIDRTVTIPNVSGTIITSGDTGTVTNTMLAGSIANTKLSNSSFSIDGNTISLGDSVTLNVGGTSTDNTWTGIQTFRDNKFVITDNTDTSKVLNLQLSSIATNTTRTLTAPNETGTIATQAYVDSAIPAGTIIDFAGATAPSGYLACPTTATNVSRTTYARLFAAIGTTWGSGDGENTFGMPYFPANYAAVQASSNVGTSTTGEIKTHTHSITDPGHTHTFTGTISGPDWGGKNYTRGTLTTNPAFTGITIDSTGGSANLAAGIRVLKCVKI